MARSIKQGLDYFPHDCNIDDQLEYIVALHKSDGYCVFFRLLEKIYHGEGYYMKADKKSLILFADKINVDINKVNAIINDCFGERLFNKTLFKKYHILTSKGIQERYLEATERRKMVTLIREYLINVDINRDNVSINLLNVDKSTQSKVKERKGEKSKGDISVKTTDEYSDFVKKWFDFYNYKTGLNPSFDGVSGSTMKTIIGKIKKMINSAKSPDQPIDVFNYILTKWDFLDPWQKENCLDIKVFNQKFDLIINKLKQENGHTEAWREYFTKHS